MNLKNTLLWGTAGLVAVSAGATFASTGGLSAAKVAGFFGHAPKSDVTRSVANIDNGVVITLSASGADAIAALQKREMGAPLRSVEKTDTGVKVTLTSSDADVVKELQANGGRMGPGMMGGREGGKGRGGMTGWAAGTGARLDFSSVKRTVTNVDNGVVVTMVSDKADVAKALQDGPAGKGPEGRDASVTVAKENIDGGVKLTITSADAAKAKEIQDREAKGPGMGRGGMMGGKGGFGGMGRGHRGGPDADAQ